MKLTTPARLRERLRERSDRLDRLAGILSATVAVWRARLARHRVAVAALGGGIAGIAFAARWRSLVRIGMTLTGAAVRAAALSAIASARVNRAVSAQVARATRTIMR